MQDVIAIVACGVVVVVADVDVVAVVDAVEIDESFFVQVAAGLDIAFAFAFDAEDYGHGGLSDAFLVDQSFETRKTLAALVFDCEDRRRGNSQPCSLHDNRIRQTLHMELDVLQLSPFQELGLFEIFD
mmetsp:Transcript_19672/g.29032  ORF Transcript_19672/g.29032 Transcript_19672/m.29032 type:complete len:128 (-) Transcript_19672:344-727(-)